MRILNIVLYTTYIIPIDENVSDSLYIRYILVRYLLSINKGMTKPEKG